MANHKMSIDEWKKKYGVTSNTPPVKKTELPQAAKPVALENGGKSEKLTLDAWKQKYGVSSAATKAPSDRHSTTSREGISALRKVVDARGADADRKTMTLLHHHYVLGGPDDLAVQGLDSAAEAERLRKKYNVEMPKRAALPFVPNKVVTPKTGEHYINNEPSKIREYFTEENIDALLNDAVSTRDAAKKSAAWAKATRDAWENRFSEDADAYKKSMDAYASNYQDLVNNEYALRQDKKTARYLSYMDLENEDDFAELSSKGSWLDDMAAEINRAASDEGKLKYDAPQMDKEELAIYNYLYNKEGREAADEYYDFLKGYALRGRIGRAKADKIQERGWLGETAGSIGVNAAAGAQDFFTNAASFITGKEAIPTATQATASIIAEDAGDFARRVYGGARSLGNMLPSVAASILTKGASRALGAGARFAAKAGQLVGSASMGVSAAGGAYNQALAEGWREEDARTYGVMIGASEGVMQYILGGIGALGGLSDDAVMAAVSRIDSSIMRIAATGGIKIASEELEEFAQLYIEPALATMIGEMAYAAPTKKDILDTAVMTAFATLPFAAAETAGIEISYKKYGDLILKQHTAPELFETAKRMNPDSESYKMASRLDPQKSTDVGRLYAQMHADGWVDPNLEGLKALGAQMAEGGEEAARGLIESGLESQPLTKSRKLATKLKEKMDRGETVTDLELAELTIANEKAIQEERNTIFDRIGKNLGKEGRSLLSNNYDGASDALEYASAMTVAYNAGAAVARGEKYNKAATVEAFTRITDAQAKAAYNAGLRDYESSLKKAKANAADSVILSEESSGFDFSNAPKDVKQAVRKFTDAFFKAMGVYGSFDGKGGNADYNAFYDRKTGGVTFAEDFGIDPELMRKLGSEDYLKKVEKLASERENSFVFYVAHEVATHVAMKRSPEKMMAFVDAMYAYTQKGKPFGGNSAQWKQEFYSRHGKTLDFDSAVEEVVADTILNLYKDEASFMAAMERIMNGTDEQAKQGAIEYATGLRGFIERLKAWWNEVRGKQTAEVQAEVDNTISELERLRDMFEAAIADSVENVKQARAEGKAVQKKSGEKSTQEMSLKEEREYLDLKSKQYNLKVEKDHRKSLESNYTSDAAVSLSELNARYDKIVDIWNRLGGELNSKFLRDWNNKTDRNFTIFKAQSGYKYNVELSSMCKKGVPLFEAIDTIVKKEVMNELGLKVIGKAEKELLYDILKQHNFEIPCAICYVEQARQREGVIIDAFLNGNTSDGKYKLGWNKVLDSIEAEMKARGVSYSFESVSRDISTEKYTPANIKMDDRTVDAFHKSVQKIANEEIRKYNKENGKNRPLLREVTPEAVKACFKGTLPANLKIFKVLLTEPNSRFRIGSDLLYSSMTTLNLSASHNELYGLFNMQGGVSGYKTKQGTTVYWGEILGKKWRPSDLRNAGGVRNQSNSDFQVYTLLDQAQMYIDFTAKGYYLQAYTKVMAELKLFGLSRGKINASLIPKVVEYKDANGAVDAERTMANAGLDENGNPIYDDFEGINHAEAFMLLEDPEYSKSIGGVCIGYSDNHITKLLDDPRVQLIIGFHDKTNDPDKRYRGARYAKNYNGLNEAVDKNGKTKHIGFNPYVKKAEARFTYNEETEAFVGSAKFDGKDYSANDIPRLAADMYLADCAKKGYTPAYNNFKGHPNYYKLLADFSLYDSMGRYAPHQKVAYNMPDAVPYLDSNGTKRYMSSEEYIKTELQKELAVRDSIAEALADTSSEGIIPQFKAAVKGIHAQKNTTSSGENSNSYKGKSLTADGDIYSYDFLVNLPAMEVKEMPPLSEVKTGKNVDRQKAIDLGMKNAANVGRKVSQNVCAVFNIYSGREIRVSQNGLGHSLDGGNVGRLRTNARLSAIAGDIIRNAVPLNALKSTNPQARGTYAMAALLKSGDIDVVAIVTVEQHTDRVTGIDYVDIAHSINGRLNTKKEGSRSSTRETGTNPATASFSISIADFLKIVNDTHRSILSEDVLSRLGEIKSPDGYYSDKTLFSLKGVPTTQELIDKYGEIDPGEEPRAREAHIPKKTSEEKKVSETVRTILEAEVTPDAAIPKIEELIASGDFSYDVYTDKEAMANAETTIRHKGYANALADWLKDVEAGKVSKSSTALGWAIYNAAATKGDLPTAMNILLHMVQHQRRAAQAVQATRILKKMSPDAQLYGVVQSVQKLEDDLNKRFGKDRDKMGKKLSVDETLAEEFMKAKTQEERDEILGKIYQDIGRQMPSTFIDKWNAWRYLAMLGNPRTHIRNIAGNAFFAPVVLAKDLTATGIEKFVNFVSGDKLQRTKAMPTKDLLAAAWGDYDNVADLVSSGGKYNDRTVMNKNIEKGHRIFGNVEQARTKFGKAVSSTLGRAVETARRTSSNLLEQEDIWFSKPHYAYALAQYCKANGITAEQIRNGKNLDAARDYAVKEAQKATYRDTNAFSEAVSRIGRSHANDNAVTKGINVLAEGLLPFRKTPANILVRGVEYSPIGLLKSLTYDLAQVKKGNMTGADAIDNISAGLTGTALLGLGVLFASLGLIRGAGDGDDKEKSFAELQGHQSYALELPDGTSVTLDWLAPEALPFFIGVNLCETARQSGEDVKMSEILSSVTNVAEPLLEMSCLQSLNSAIDNIGYASANDVPAIATLASTLLTSYLTQAFPTLAGQLERSAQSDRMTTYTEKNAFLTSDMQYTLGKVSAKIPGWDYNQIPYIDAWGRTENAGNIGARSFNNLLNPAYMSKVDSSQMEEELLRLYKATDEAKVLPSRADKYFTVNKERKDLTGDEYVKYATEKGKMSYEMVSSLVSSGAYNSLSDVDKADAIGMVYSYANAIAKTKVSDYKLDGWIAKADKTCKTTGIKPETYIILQKQKGDIEGLKYTSGKDKGDTIANSKSLQIMQMIYNVKGLSAKQREALFDDFDVGKSVRNYSPALVNQKIDRMQKQ